MVASRGLGRTLNGQALSSWRSRPRRRLLVLMAGISLLLFLLGTPTQRPLVSGVGLLAYGVTAVMLRITTRGVADYPDGVLDERQVVVRNAAYLNAYRAIGGLIALLAIGFVCARILGGGALAADWVEQALFSLLFSAIVAPSCVVAWTEKEG